MRKQQKEPVLSRLQDCNAERKSGIRQTCQRKTETECREDTKGKQAPLGGGAGIWVAFNSQRETSLFQPLIFKGGL